MRSPSERILNRKFHSIKAREEKANSLDPWAARNHFESLKNPPKSIDGYLNSLKAQELARAVSALRDLMP
jgi:hypothetical protein